MHALAEQRNAWFVALCCVALGMIVAGALHAGLALARPALAVELAKKWQPAPIIDGEVELRGLEHVTRAEFRFRYRFRGRTLLGKRYAFAHPARFLSEGQLLQLRDHFPTTCFVNPEQPRDAVIERGLPMSAYRFDGLAALVLGLCVTLFLSVVGRRVFATRRLARMLLLGAPLTVVLAGAALWLYQVPHFDRALYAALPFALAAAWMNRALVLVIGFGLLLSGLLVLFSAIDPYLSLSMVRDATHEPFYRLSFIASTLADGLPLLTFSFATFWAADLLRARTKDARS